MKNCRCCGAAYTPTGNRQKYCVSCASGIRAMYQHDWYLGRRDALVARCKKYYAAHKEDNALKCAAYRIEHREEIAVRTRKWYVENPGMVKIGHGKCKAKRRVLGFIPMNQPFDGCNGHHIDRERVVYIPEVLHMSIRHNVWNGRNMGKINAVAFNFLFKQEVEAALGRA